MPHKEMLKMILQMNKQVNKKGQASILSLSNVFGADNSGCKRAGLAPYQIRHGVDFGKLQNLKPPARCRCKAPYLGAQTESMFQ